MCENVREGERERGKEKEREKEKGRERERREREKVFLQPTRGGCCQMFRFEMLQLQLQLACVISQFFCVN